MQARRRTAARPTPGSCRFPTWVAAIGLSGLLWLGFSPATFAQFANLGQEFVVNTNTSECIGAWDVGMAPDGRFVVVWPGSYDNSVEGRLFDSSGAPLADQQTLATGSGIFNLATDVDPSGAFVVVWAESGGGNSVVRGQRFASDGTPQGGVLAISSATGEHAGPDVAVASSGDFVVAWRKGNPSSEIAARRYDSAGGPVGSEWTVNTSGTDLSDPRIDFESDDDRRFVIAWTDQSTAFDDEAKARRYASDGSAQGGELLVASYTTGSQRVGDVRVDASGDFVVSWAGADPIEPFRIFGSRFGAAGGAIEEIPLDDAGVSGIEFSPALAVSEDGGSRLAAWRASYLDGMAVQQDNVFMTANQQIDFGIGISAGRQEDARVELDQRERGFVGWRSDPADTFCHEIRAQRLQTYHSTGISYPHQAEVHSLSNQAAWKFFVYTPSSSAEIRVDVTDLPGFVPRDVDLYLGLTDFPTLSSYECRSFAGGSSDESCTIFTTGQPILIGINGYEIGKIQFTLDVTETPTLFADDFESGSTTKWSAAVPSSP